MELLGCVGGPGPEELEVIVQIRVGVVEGVQVDYMDTLERPQWSPLWLWSSPTSWALNSSLRSRAEGRLE